MIFQNEKKILNIIKYSPPIFIISMGMIISSFLYLENQRTFSIEKQKIQEEHIQSNKKLIREKVHDVYNYIVSEQQDTKKELKEQLQEAVFTAYNIAQNIYRNNQHKSIKEVQTMIKDALRTIRFNEGRGYYFVYELNTGKNILLPTSPKRENTLMLNHKDAKGMPIIQHMNRLLLQKNEIFYEWYWYKPNEHEQQKKKLGFMKVFEPFNWFIGTGEYIEDFEKYVQKKVLKHIQNIRYGENGYIFVIDYDSIYLSHIRKNFIGQNAITNNDTIGIKDVIEDITAIAKNGEGYYSYTQNKKPDNDLPTHKISFVKGLNNWSWMIGTGFYEDDINKTLLQKKDELNEKFSQYIKQTILICIIMTFILLVISFYVSKLLRIRFHNYKKEINQHLLDNNKQQNIIAQQSKMAAMGEMISNIAHQWRQPLSIITTTSTGMKVQKEVSLLSDDDFYEGMDNINNSAQYLSQTIEDFRNFFNSKKTKLPFRLIEVIDKTLNLLHAQFNNKNIHIIKEIQDITLTNLENEFIQVLMNILNNARDELVKNSSREKYIFIHAVKKEKSVQITIKDNAGGIPPSIISRIFEPYFTTKHKRQGTGIGLYMSQEIITKNMEGAIEASNCTYEYKGTTYKGALFTIELYD